MSDGRFGRLGGGRGPGSHGSNPAHMDAMDLQTRPRGAPAAAPAARYGDNSALSARHMLIRHKLMERKRFDSADYAMDKNKRQKEGAREEEAPSPARVGASAFFSALQDQPSPPPPAAAVADAETRAARYGGLATAGAASARSILLQKKLREKKHFDSADYQLAQQQQASPSAGSSGGPSALFVGTSSGGSSPMDVDEEDADAGGINSPSAARVGVAAAISSGELRLAQMSPSVRGGGGRPDAFGSPSRHPQPPGERFFVPAGGSEPGPDSDGTSETTAAPGGASKYGKLCAAHVLIRRQLRERKRFDSADYAMEKQSGAPDEPADETREADEGGSAGALRGGHVVMSSPTRHHERRRASVSASPAFLRVESSATSPSISHQVKHIKLSEDARAATGHGMGWRGVSSSGSNTNPVGSRAATMSQDSRLAARSIILQRKLAERKRFDSADYYKSRSTTSG